jgi:hypothetical protein
MREHSLLGKHIDLLAIAVVLIGYFVFSGLHNGSLASPAVAARERLQRRLRPVHVRGHMFRFTRRAPAVPLQLV